MTQTEGPLQWAYNATCTAESLGITDDQFTQAEQVAIAFLWAYSGRRYGTRNTLLRPQSRQPRGRVYWPGMQPVSGPLYGLPYGGGWECEGPEAKQLIELDAPVASITSVTIEGALVDAGIWRQEGSYLVRQDGGDWPQTQNLITQLGGINTWSVSYVRGFQIDAYGQAATDKLVCWLGGQIKSGKACAVPFNATNVTRAGVTINRDASKATKTTGVEEVDRWLAMVNPAGLTREPTIWSPDIDRRRRPFAGSYQGVPASTQAAGVPEGARLLVLGQTEDVPPDTPIGTVILRTPITP